MFSLGGHWGGGGGGGLQYKYLDVCAKGLKNGPIGRIYLLYTLINYYDKGLPCKLTEFVFTFFLHLVHFSSKSKGRRG